MSDHPTDTPASITPPTTPANPPAPIALGQFGAEPDTLEQMLRVANLVSKSGFAPKGLERPEAIAVAMLHGRELGLTALASLQSIAVVNGRPAIYGDAALALVRGSNLCESYSQRIEGQGDERRAIVSVRRKDDPEPIVAEFSVKDAKNAGLWGKQGPWSQYPDRMLLFRARGFALRDAFGDVLKGLRTTEEARDIEDAEVVSPPIAEKPRKKPAIREAVVSEPAQEGGVS